MKPEHTEGTGSQFCGRSAAPARLRRWSVCTDLVAVLCRIKHPADVEWPAVRCRLWIPLLIKGLLAVDPQASDKLRLDLAVFYFQVKGLCFADKFNLTGVCVGGKDGLAAFLRQWRAVKVGLSLQSLFVVHLLAQILRCSKVWAANVKSESSGFFWVIFHRLSWA